ncbi:hypothetical protein BDQ94DRAFT_168782 [Aspergillus welwitschiae]|uniref:Uncharacterized protein n=1 Tax=Aspergillus welwitschiae TaxID=1341132 RepID=A0A3F3Q7E7_9EURO|nr:hypothetical protein BDQ94DRAFT_168782 [Aspergillus welwitschiae]RDH35110.1 hypothetical protein BDQ94DRAFT_168782 [Aspergillus welwitschiae]
MRAAANKGARLVEAIQFMEDIKGWNTGEAEVCTITEQALRGKPNFIEELTELIERLQELSTKLTFSKKVKAFAEFPEAEQGTTIRRLNHKIYERCAGPRGKGRNRDTVNTMQLMSIPSMKQLYMEFQWMMKIQTRNLLKFQDQRSVRRQSAPLAAGGCHGLVEVLLRCLMLDVMLVDCRTWGDCLLFTKAYMVDG